jgi:hypothetical protein
MGAMVRTGVRTGVADSRLISTISTETNSCRKTAYKTVGEGTGGIGARHILFTDSGKPGGTDGETGCCA